MRLPRLTSVVALVAVASALAACGGTQVTPSPISPSTSPPTAAPTAPPTSPPTNPPPTASAEPTDGTAPPLPSPLTPSRSDAGIAARVTIANDSRLETHDGTYEIYGVAADGSSCSASFDGTEFTAVAQDEAAPDGAIIRFSVTVRSADIPVAGGTKADIRDGRVSFDFASESGIGTTYTGDSTADNDGSSTIAVTGGGAWLTFDFEGVTYDDVSFAGQLICVQG